MNATPSTTARISGATRLMGVIGQGISYTRSPAMHNAAAQVLGVDAVYLPIDIAAEHVAGFLEVAWQLGALGFNVTKPHKGLVARLVPSAGLSSVNTLRRGDKGWEAASTDGGGFVRGLRQMGVALADIDTVVVLGNGGAVKAIVPELDGKRLVILRRDARRDGDLAASGAQFRDFDPGTLAKALREGGPRCLLVQGTSAPQHGEDLSAFVPALSGWSGAVVDLVYARPSALVAAAQVRGLPAQDGEAMLIEQARLSQELWWGRSCTYQQLQAALASE